MTQDECRAEHDRAIEALRASVDEAIHGNGKPGIKTSVALLQQQVNTLTEDVAGLRKAVWGAAAAAAFGSTGLTKALQLLTSGGGL